MRRGRGRFWFRSGGRALTDHAKKSWAGPALAAAAVLAATAFLLRWQGRLWVCSCGLFLVWTGEAWSPQTSQHLFDPYSLTHVLHGFAFCWLLAWAAPRVPASWRFLIAVAAEALWEVIENSRFVIQRYREGTAALGYEGDTIVNSLGDVAACALGFLIARRLGFTRSLAVFALVESLLLFWIRDSLLLNVIMLVYPLNSIKEWQSSH